MTDTFCPQSAPMSSHSRCDWAPSLFRDLKLKRKRVMDIVSNDEELRSKSASCSDSDQKSETDSAYISDRSSHSSDSISIDDHPLKKRPLRENTDSMRFDQFTHEIKSSVRHQKMTVGNGGFNTGVAFFGLPPGYVNVMQTHPVTLDTSAGILPGGMRLIPVMGPAPGLIQGHMRGPPMLIAAPPAGFVCNSKGAPMVKKEVNPFDYLKSYGQGYSKANTHVQRDSPDIHQVYKASDKLMDSSEKAVRDQQFIAHYTNGQFNYMGHVVNKPEKSCDKDSQAFRDEDSETDDNMMMCAICNDRSTGLHYGIITCEGCKGFFKRTVQNKRVYACVAEGNCIINKAQRNRCQYCRFKKCLLMGMVLAAVREDRMPGGRNSGAVYNMYKMKYKKHKRRDVTVKMFKQRLAQIKAEQMFQSMDGHRDRQSDCSSWHPAKEYNNYIRSASPSKSCQPPGYPPTLTSASPVSPVSSHVAPRKQVLQEAVSENSQAELLINELIKADSLLGIAESYRIDEISGTEQSIGQVLCNIGDDIVHRLVQWIRQLPFCEKIPNDIQSNILTSKWHELVLLIMTSYTALQGGTPSYEELYERNIRTLQNYLNNTFNKAFSAEQLHLEVGSVLEKVTRIMAVFSLMRISRQEYVCLQIILLMNHSDMQWNPVIERIQKSYMAVLQQYVNTHYPHEPKRYGELLLSLHYIQSASSLLLKTKMIYIPFLLNSTGQPTQMKNSNIE